VVTIKRIEQGTLAMSRSIADKLEAALGVSAAYLRHGKASKTPTTPTGEPFTADTFARRELEIREGSLIQSAAFFPFRWAAKLGAIADSAGDKNRLLAFHYKVEALALELQKEFGIKPKTQAELLRLCSEPSGGNLLEIGAHDDNMSPATFRQLASRDGLPYKATTKTTTTTRRIGPDRQKALAAYEKLTTKKARPASSRSIKRRRQGKV
jgi:hypothetical protein